MMTRMAMVVVPLLVVPLAPAVPVDWPPPLRGAKDGTVTLQSELFLHVPASVAAAGKQEGAAFVVARTPPAVDFAFHRDLGPEPVNRRLWSSWGDIGLAGDGRVYCGIGDHGGCGLLWIVSPPRPPHCIF